MAPNLLSNAQWQCQAQPVGSTRWNDSPDAATLVGVPVPATAAAALHEQGLTCEGRDLDSEDWWYRTEFGAPDDGQLWRLRLDGLAALADVWLNGEHLLRSENMFVRHVLDVGTLPIGNQLIIRFAALNEALSPRRRPRPRWRVARLRSQNMRWFRTSLLGRLDGWVASPAPVGPWRPISITPVSADAIEEPRVSTRVAGGVGYVDVSVTIPGAGEASVVCGGSRSRLDRIGDRFSASLKVAQVRLWWPHTHGDQPLYDLVIEADEVVVHTVRVGFRTVAVDDEDGAFRVSVNGTEMFCRGAYWTPLDPIGLQDTPAQLRRVLGQLRAANLNMVRVGAETVYPGADFLDACDELGLMVWHDAMFAFVDLPEDPALGASIDLELSQQLAVMQGHPCIAVVCGGSEVEQQATYSGTTLDAVPDDVVQRILPSLVESLLPGTPYVPSTPTGGTLPTDPRSGVSHYYGVGAYLRHPSDARLANVRFAAECLAFATPPERATVDEACGGAARAGHHQEWKAAVYRDAAASWDFEDVRDHYVHLLFGVEPRSLRRTDPERALDLGRAAVAELFEASLSEWRRHGSTCAGAIVFHYRDSRPGAGLGIVDALDRPKASWYAMRRTMQPVAVTMTDEGLNGVDAHLLNDLAAPFEGELRIELFAHGDVCVEHVRSPVMIPGRGSVTVPTSGLLGAFRDLNNAHLFGPPAFDVVALTLDDHTGAEVSQAVFLPGGPRRPVEPDIGLSARTAQDESGQWSVVVSTKRFAQRVVVETTGATARDSWFHLLPGRSRAIGVHSASVRPQGRIRALNSQTGVRIDAQS